MTVVTVNAGICGFTSRIEASKLSSRVVTVSISSACEMVSELAARVSELNWHDVLRPRPDSLLNKSTADCIKHAACPVPAAIVKAIEVEMGLALPRDVVIHFETPEAR